MPAKIANKLARCSEKANALYDKLRNGKQYALSASYLEVPKEMDELIEHGVVKPKTIYGIAKTHLRKGIR